MANRIKLTKRFFYVFHIIHDSTASAIAKMHARWFYILLLTTVAMDGIRADDDDDDSDHTEAPSHSESGSESAVLVFLEYSTLTPCGKSQRTCCSDVFRLGGAFYFGYGDEFVGTATGTVRLNFGGDSCDNGVCDGDSCDNGPFFQVFGQRRAPAARLKHSGGIGVHHVQYNGSTSTAIEWSGVIIADRDGHSIDVGTIQIWLLPEDIIGLVYHLTGEYFGFYVYYREHDYVVIEDDSYMLHQSEAFLFLPNDSYQARAIVPWLDPPDVCLNPLRSPPFASSSSGDTEDSASVGDFHYDPLGGAANVSYTPLEVCGAAGFAEAGSDSDVAPRSARTSKRTGAIIGGTLGGALFVVVVAMVFLALY